MASKMLKYKHRRAIYLLVACQMDEERVAHEIGVTKATLKKWMKKPSFAQKLEERMQHIENYDSRSIRSRHNRQITDKVYEEIHRRIIEGHELHDMSLARLIKISRDLASENRLDDGEATSKVEHKHSLDDLIARYQAYIAAGHQPELKLIEPPIEVEKKEIVNG